MAELLRIDDAASARAARRAAQDAARRESVAEWALREALAAPPLSARALDVVGAVMREQRAADVAVPVVGRAA